MNISPLEVAYRTVIIYAVVLAGIRLTGKREAGQMAAFELTPILLLANSAQNAMNGIDTSLTCAVVGCMRIVHYQCDHDKYLFSLEKVKHPLEGSPTVRILKDKTVTKSIHREHIAHDGLEEALRNHGISTLKNV